MIDNKLKELVHILTEHKKTVSTMESCTGGAVVNAITNVEGASEVLKFSAVTYSNEYKIKMGVDKKVIDEYSVYSVETAMEMSKNISVFANSNYGIGITGKLNRVDKNNLYEENNVVFISIYDAENQEYHNSMIKVDKNNRMDNKNLVLGMVINKFLDILKAA